MDNTKGNKVVLLARAGSGKTSYYVKRLKSEKRYLILTYTNSNKDNIRLKILEQFKNRWPNNVYLMTYFDFLYNFCYKPLISDPIKDKGMYFERPKYDGDDDEKPDEDKAEYYLTKDGHIYSARLGLFLKKLKIMDRVRDRIKEFFDVLIIDEFQDFGGRDFDFICDILQTDINMFFVGDFYQHTYDTSRDGWINGTLYTDEEKYEERLWNAGLYVDKTTLIESYRCNEKICRFIRNHLGINIKSHKDHESEENGVYYIKDEDKRVAILNDPKIVKLYDKESYRHGGYSRNWGDIKGEDCYTDVCVVLTKNATEILNGEDEKRKRLSELPPGTKNKLYVAITRARRKVYLLEYRKLNKKTKRSRKG